MLFVVNFKTGMPGIGKNSKFLEEMWFIKKKYI